MKTILILFVISLAKSDKLDKLYLPPIGANFSGGSFDGTVPFQVPEERLTIGKNGPENRFISDFDPKENYVGRDSSVYGPTGPPITNAKSVSIVPSSDKRNDQVPQGQNQPVNSDAYNPAQNSDYYNKDNTDPSIASDRNQFEGSTDSTLPSQPNSAQANYGGRNPINTDSKVFPGKINYVRYPQRVPRPQDEADRNAVILNYDNVITPEGFAYSYDTSNGIHADEKGTAVDGVKADGSYSYIGDDGKLYNVTYSADENGFQPRGDHLPTSPPIPDAILKVIEQAARDKMNGIFDDGSYDDNKYGYQKYQTPRERFISRNKPTPTRKYNIQNEKTNNYAEDGNLGPRDKNDYPKSTTNSPSYTSDVYTIDDTRTPSHDGQNGVPYKSHTVNLIQEPNKDFRQDTASRKSYQSQEPSDEVDLSKDQSPQNEGYKYPSPSDKFDSSNFNNNKGLVNYDYNAIKQKPDSNKQSHSTENTVYDKSVPNKSPFIDDERLNLQNNNVNRLNEPERGSSYGNKDYQYGQRIPSRTPTRYPYDNYSTLTTSRPFSIPQRIKTPNAYSESDIPLGTNYSQIQEPISSSNYPSNDQIIENFNSNTGRPNIFYHPSSTERINPIDVFTGLPTKFYGPSSTERIIPTDAYTGRPTNFYGSSYTGRINPIDAYTGRPTNFYGPLTTERINPIDANTGRPTNFYGPSTTERIIPFDAYTGRPSNFYGPSTTDRIIPIDAYTGRPSNFYGPSTTERIIPTDAYTGRPTNFYVSSSTGKINPIDANTGQPTNFYGPSTTERIIPIDAYTGRPTNFYGPSTTESIIPIDAYTRRPNNYYGPSSTERINDIVTYGRQPSDFYGPSSTDRPNYSLNPSSTASTKQTAPNDVYSPTSIDRIKQVGDINSPQSFETGRDGGKPSNIYDSTVTEGDNLSTYSDGPSTYNGRDRIIKYPDQPNVYYGPSSTERIKQFDTYTGRPNNYYSPSSVEKVKQIGSNDAPQTEKDISTGGKIEGEDFSGPKRPQSYDPKTGYHY